MLDLWANGKFDFINRQYFASGKDGYVALIVNNAILYVLFKIYSMTVVV